MGVLIGPLPIFGWVEKPSKRGLASCPICYRPRKFSTMPVLKPLPSDQRQLALLPRHFMSFGTTESACNQIIEALIKDSTKMVGLHGLGGVGKTTLAKFVGNQLRQKMIFDQGGG
ncbi:hypothetical protein CUMW_264830 [Citrus unshiu]|uniref:NB-ARC domain-containing protein n=1 Tax=Citrus unshiu TaxID=55188 RepID=A0A2H5QW48_CITUN|nr:hypothetical protein CUMW_264830 [Citrus unshiu]